MEQQNGLESLDSTMKSHEMSALSGDCDSPCPPPSSPQFEPIVQLDIVETKSNEEDEEELLNLRCKLYRFDRTVDPHEWKERGVGDVKLLCHKKTNVTRLLMRQEKTLKIRANHLVNMSVELKAHSSCDRAWVWNVHFDIADMDPKHETFAIKFSNVENATKFQKAFDECRVRTAAPLPSPPPEGEWDGEGYEEDKGKVAVDSENSETPAAVPEQSGKEVMTVKETTKEEQSEGEIKVEEEKQEVTEEEKKDVAQEENKGEAEERNEEENAKEIKLQESTKTSGEDLSEQRSTEENETSEEKSTEENKEEENATEENKEEEKVTEENKEEEKATEKVTEENKEEEKVTEDNEEKTAGKNKEDEKTESEDFEVVKTEDVVEEAGGAGDVKNVEDQLTNLQLEVAEAVDNVPETLK